MLATIQEAESWTGEAGAPDEDAAPRRRCIATGDSKPVADLIRFVVGPEGRIVPDVAGDLPGRGIWISADRVRIEKAVEKGLFARAARRNVVVDPTLPAQVEELLLRRCLERIGLARRGGGAVAGFEKVRALLASGRAGLVMAASDAAADGRQKIRRVAPEVPVIDLFSRSELGQAFGRDQAVHAALMSGRMAALLWADASRLAGLRPPKEERNDAE